MTRFVALSGTIMRKSMLDFGHILRWALKDGAPVPRTSNELQEWAAALDDRVNELDQYEPGALMALAPGGASLEDVRRGFRQRLVETPGVVSTIGEGERVDCSIYIRALKYDVRPITNQHFTKLRKDWLTPDDWGLSQGTEVWRVAKELALGFHYVRVEKEKYSEWLNRTIRRQKPESEPKRTIESEKQKILKGVAGTIKSTTKNTKPRKQLSNELGEQITRSDTKQTADGTSWRIRKSTSRGPEPERSPSLGSPQQSMPSCSPIRAGVVQSVEGLASKHCTLTTIIGQEEFEASCAARAIEGSAYSLTMSTSYREQFSTFLQTARPPTDWLNARKAWTAFVRDVLSRSRKLDSELQIVHACEAGLLPRETLDAWRAAKDTFKPVTVAMWHDFSALQACAEWMKRPGVVWTEHQFFAECLAAITGCKYYGAKGLTSRGEFIDDADPNEACIASIDANREGRNLQNKWSRMLITSPPEGADVWQQTIGRLHRPGQTADEVEVDVMLGCVEHANAMRKALQNAAAVRDTTGAESKLLIADLDWPSESEIESYAGARWRN